MTPDMAACPLWKVPLVGAGAERLGASARKRGGQGDGGAGPVRVESEDTRRGSGGRGGAERVEAVDSYAWDSEHVLAGGQHA